MANEEVLGPRKTMFVLVIVVGCFAVLWPRILSPLILGPSRDQLKPNQFDREAAVKQERPPIRGGTHPALRERGRAIPPGVPTPAPRAPVAMPPHIRPPPIPGMRPPLGSPGGPVPAPKSSMGFVMPIYTICIIVFFVYTLSKILFKRSASPYETMSPDPQFRRRVFRDDSRTSPDKLGPKERDTIVTAISGLVAEVRQQMESSYAQCQQNQEAQDSQTRSYTNGTILHNSGPVHIVASEIKEKSPEPKEKTPELPETKKAPEESTEPIKDGADIEEEAQETKEQTPELKEVSPEPKEPTPELDVFTPESKGPTPDSRELTPEEKESSPEKETTPEIDDPNNIETEILKLTVENKEQPLKRSTEEFLEQTRLDEERLEKTDLKKSTSQLLEEALREESPQKEDEENENASVKREMEDVQEIFLQTEIPQQSRLIVTDFEEDTEKMADRVKQQPLVVSGKMTLSLIQDAPRDTPEKELESTLDDFTTASGVTQPAEEEENSEEEEEEEIEEEIEVEEIEEEVTDEEEAQLQEDKPKNN